MVEIQIKEESLPERCEICHQTDCFDPQTNYCSRCSGIEHAAFSLEQSKNYQECFFAVSLPKLIVMSICTFGLYEFYWFYKNWDYINDRSKLSIRPIWRAIFSYFFCYSLFKRVRQFAEGVNIKTGISPALLTLLYLVLRVFERLPGPAWLIGFLSVLPLLPVQSLINRINLQGSSQIEINNKFSRANKITIAIGSLVLIFAIVGTFGNNSERQTSIFQESEDVQTNSEKDKTALMNAAIRGESKNIKELLSKGEDVNAKDNAGDTALIYAAETGHTEIVKMLYAAGATVNSKDVNGLTALMYATINDDIDTVKTLLSIGASVNIRNNIGKNALNYANEHRNTKIIKLLKDAGGVE